MRNEEKKPIMMEEFCAKKSVERKRRPKTEEVRVRGNWEFEYEDMGEAMGTLTEKERNLLTYIYRKYGPHEFLRLLRLDALRLMVDPGAETLKFIEFRYDQESWEKELLIWNTPDDKKGFIGKVNKYASSFIYPHHFDYEVAKYLVCMGPTECQDIALEIYESYLDIDMSKNRLYDALKSCMSTLQYQITVDVIEKDIELSSFEADILSAGKDNIKRNFEKFRSCLLGATMRDEVNEKLKELMKKAKVDDWHDILVTDLYGYVSQTQLHSRLIINLDRQEETRTLGKICEYTEAQLRTFRNIGTGCTQELKRILGYLGLSLKRDT